MKPKHYLSLALLSGACALFSLATPALAANNSTASSSRSSTGSSQDNNPQTQRVRVTRATNFLGTDVIASDGRKVGDIVDYYLDPNSSPHLKYVIVAQGSVLGYGGDQRAVPADAISMQGDTAHVKLSSDEFWRVAVLPGDHDRYLEDSRNQDQLAQTFGTSSAHNSSQQQNSGSLISFSELQNSDVYGSDGQRLGRIVDAWMNLDDNRAPYAEISSPPESPFQVLPRYRYAVPMSEVKDNANAARLQVSITADQLRDSKPISETDGVKILQSGDIGKEVLRVRVAQL